MSKEKWEEHRPRMKSKGNPPVYPSDGEMSEETMRKMRLIGKALREGGKDGLFELANAWREEAERAINPDDYEQGEF